MLGYGLLNIEITRNVTGQNGAAATRYPPPPGLVNGYITFLLFQVTDTYFYLLTWSHIQGTEWHRARGRIPVPLLRPEPRPFASGRNSFPSPP